MFDHEYTIYKIQLNILVYAVIVFTSLCILIAYMFFTHQTGDAHMFNMTNESWGYMKNATIGKPSIIFDKLGNVRW
jgi:hypothetical protein